jgi:hypothetical protein
VRLAGTIGQQSRAGRMKKFIVILTGIACSLLVAAERPDPEAACKANLERLGGAVRAYRIVHDGKGPEHLSDLFTDGYVENLGDFICPASQTKITSSKEIDTNSDFTLDPLPDTKDLIVREKSPGHADGKVLGVFADGTIKLLAAPGSSGAGATPNAGNIAFGAILAIVVLGGLAAAALWAYAYWVRRPMGQRQRAIPEVIGRVTQAMRQLRAAMRPPREFVNTARHRWGQIARKVAATGRKSVSPPKSPPVERHPLAAEKAVKSRGVSCPSCNTPNSAPAKFCRSCGATLGASQAAVLAPSTTCQACGKPLTPGAKFCAACGFRVM